MQVGSILAIGTELTLGQTVDTNSAWLARQLAAFGIRTVAHYTLPDEQDAIADLVRRISTDVDVLVISGGLGPTDDDLTRPALAAAAGTELKLDAASLAHLESFFAARKRVMPDRNRIQAFLPAGAAALPNDCGTAPGMRLELGGCTVFALPGVPHEMRAMFRQSVAPELEARARGSVLISRTIRTYGRAEAEVNDLLGDLLMRGKNPEIGTTAALGEIGVRINVRAENRVAAEGLLEAAEAQVRGRLGWAVYGRDADTLAAAVGAALQERRATLSVAESCTGGLLGSLITANPGSSDYFSGGALTYSNDCKRRLLGVAPELLTAHGAVSAACAAAMAAAARERCNSTYALSITGIAGPGGGTPGKPVGLVYLGLAGPDGIETRECHFGADQPRDVIRERAARAALNWLRRTLAGHADE